MENNMRTDRIYDLEERTYKYALSCRNFIRNQLKSIPNFEYSKQLIRSSGSVAANYIEANEALSVKDYYHCVKICRKEIKESILWLKLLTTENNQELDNLLKESNELMKIFGSIICSNKNKKD